MFQTPSDVCILKTLLIFFNRYKLIVGSVGISFLLLVFFSLGLLTRLDAIALDLQFRLLSIEKGAESTEDVVVVGIDDASLKEFSVPVAILHRQIGGFFEAAALGRAQGVGIDVVLPEVSFDHVQPGLEAALASGIVALRSAAP